MLVKTNTPQDLLELSELTLLKSNRTIPKFISTQFVCFSNTSMDAWDKHTWVSNLFLSTTTTAVGFEASQVRNIEVGIRPEASLTEGDDLSPQFRIVVGLWILLLVWLYIETLKLFLWFIFKFRFCFLHENKS